MRIGTVREVKRHEYRVGLTPGCVRSFVGRGHAVLVQRGAGDDAGFDDAQYEAAGATIIETAGEVWAASDMVVKVKEPQASEFEHHIDA